MSNLNPQSDESVIFTDAMPNNPGGEGLQVPQTSSSQSGTGSGHKTGSTKASNSSRKQSKKTFSCKACNKPDDNDMVACDTCEKWFHFVCVGVDESIKDHDWNCESCNSEKANLQSQQTHEINGGQPQTAPTGQNIVNETIVPAKEHQTMTSNTNAPPNGDNRTDIEQTSDNNTVTQAQPLNNVNIRTTDGKSAISQKPSQRTNKSERALALLEEKRKLALKMAEAERKLQEERDNRYIQRLLADEQKYLEEKIHLEYAGSSRHSPTSSEVAAKWVDNHQEIFSQHGENNHQMNQVRHVNGKVSTEQNVHQVANPTQNPIKPKQATTCDYHQEALNNQPQSTPNLNQEARRTSNYGGTGTDAEQPFSRFADVSKEIFPWNNPNRASGHQKDNVTFNIPHYTSKDGRTMTDSHIAARLVIGKKALPEFSGKPGEWPNFVSAFIRSTEKCGYTEDENIDRLGLCLKGEARKLVEGRLKNPANLSSIMDTLYRNFGLPELIVDDLIEKAKSQPAIQDNRLDRLLIFSAAVEDLCDTVQNSQMKDEIDNRGILRELVVKLPAHLQMSWSFHVTGKRKVDVFMFNTWLISVADAAGRLPKPKQGKAEVKTEGKGRQRLNRVNAHKVESNTSATEKSTSALDATQIKCLHCDANNHYILKCDAFIALPKRRRWEIVIRRRLCRKCLEKHHTKTCSKEIKCNVDGCNGEHNFLLHNSRNDAKVPEKSETTSNEAATINHHRSLTSILYRIIPVRIHGKKVVDTYAFLDDGSSISMMENSLAVQLGLEGPSTDLCLTWTNDVSRIETGSQLVSFNISGTNDSSKTYKMTGVYTVKNLDLPQQSLEVDKSHEYLSNVPIQQYENAIPTILIGLDNINLTVPLRIRQGERYQPVATKTRLGWTLCGPANLKQTSNNFLNVHACNCGTDTLETLVRNYITLDNLGVSAKKSIECEEDTRARQILQTTTKFLGQRYETGLLWRRNDVVLPDSYKMAENRLFCLERKLMKDPTLKEIVCKQFRDYVEKGYARHLEDTTRSNITWYLPVFTVRNSNKPNKVRLVWDAAAKSKGVALNDVLLKGPDLVPRLIDILFKFREKRIAVSGDIAEMFHQVKIRQADQDAQRYLWRNCDTSQSPKTYIMESMTFGSTCSPCSAQYVKNINAERFEDEHPQAAQAIKTKHYVDDYLDSFDDEKGAIDVVVTVQKIHLAGGFHIRNWRSNSPVVIEALGSQSEQPIKEMSSLDTSTDKVLGLSWDTSNDVFVFLLNKTRINWDIMSGEKVPSKREVLRTLMCIFDPLGLISSYLVYAKILLQEIWHSGTDWDTPIKHEHLVKWRNWVQHLSNIEKIAIPRSYLRNPVSEGRYDLHIFVDASEAAYAAVAYICADHHGTRTTTLICSKTKVAPSKPTSIPRLELLAAVLGARLMKTVSEAHTINFQSRWLWSDSHTVLAWLRSDARKFRQFVGLRISECLELTTVDQWRWVPTRHNVADEATKWYNSTNFGSESRWYTGPEFLKCEPKDWPEQIVIKQPEAADEMKRCMIHDVRTINKIDTPDLESYSTWKRLCIVQATFLRAARNWIAVPRKQRRLRGRFLKSEWKRAKTALILKAQRDTYPDDIQRLMCGDLERNSSIYQYSPMIDEDGVVRMQGRIDQAEDICNSMKNPIILPTNHRVTGLIVEHFHVKFNHLNHETVINELRQRYVIPRLRVLLRKIRNRCQLCRNRAARPVPPLMGSLPKERITPNRRPFSYVGLDYFGPIEVKIENTIRKRYGALFTCLTTRALHLEVAESLSSDSAIKCILRFISRRGAPIKIFSDNGTNFRGASNEIRKAMKAFPKDEVTARFPEMMDWNFIPPNSPHFGGAWERLVRSVKTNLQNMLRGRRPSLDTLQTVFTEVEFILNSRPLTHVQLESSDMEAITPNHLILGSSDGRKPFFKLEDEGPSKHYQCQWKTVQQIAQAFWRRWIAEYLPTLVRRTKWFKAVEPLEVGDVVIAVDPKSAYNTWPRGTIQDVTKGRDGQVRSAVVKIGNNLYSRPAVRLAKLDVRKIELSRDGSSIGGEC